MKAINYLKEMDNLMTVVRSNKRKKSAWVRGHVIGQLEGIKSMALWDNDVSPRDYDEIVLQKLEYEKEIRNENETI